MALPCRFDNNGECLVCDCWPSGCAWRRLWAGDFRWESLDQLLKMFAAVLTEEQVLDLRNRHTPNP